MTQNLAQNVHVQYRVREMLPGDSRAYAELLAHNPDIGRLGIEIHYKNDAYEMLMQRRLGEKVFVAELPDGTVVGSGACDTRPVWFQEQPVLAVHLHSLFVHVKYRGQGVATALVQHRIQWAQETVGENALIFAEIQQGNQAAIRNAKHWVTAFDQTREMGFMRTNRRPATAPPGVTVREATVVDYPAIAEGLNDFNYRVNFSRYVTVDRLRRNLEPIHGQVFRHRYVVEQGGEIVGGAVLSRHDPSTETRMIRAPLLLRLGARLGGVIDSEGVIDAGEIDGIWFKPGCGDTAHYLFEYLRYIAWADGKMNAINLNVLNPAAWVAVQVSHWQPHTVHTTAYRLAHPEQPPVPYEEPAVVN